MVRKVYGGQAPINEDEEIVKKVLKLPLEERKRVRDLIQTLQSYDKDNKKIAEKLIETMKTGKFRKDDYNLLVKTGIIIPVEETQPETRTKDMIKQERKFQKERLYEFFNEMVKPMGEKFFFSGDFMKKTS